MESWIEVSLCVFVLMLHIKYGPANKKKSTLCRDLKHYVDLHTSTHCYLQCCRIQFFLCVQNTVMSTKCLQDRAVWGGVPTSWNLGLVLTFFFFLQSQDVMALFFRYKTKRDIVKVRPTNFSRSKCDQCLFGVER